MAELQKSDEIEAQACGRNRPRVDPCNGRRGKLLLYDSAPPEEVKAMALSAKQLASHGIDPSPIRLLRVRAEARFRETPDLSL